VASKSELVRLAASDRRSAVKGDGFLKQAVLDRTGTMPGRGAYLCREPVSTGPSADCLALATRRGGVARALRGTVKIDPELLESTRGWRSQPPAGKLGPSTNPIIR
jgi:predicted RNA-binding protein YlxR (DUF448 family)